MREYKFRGKRIDNGEWVYGYYFIEERDIEDGIIWRDIPQIQQRYGDHFQYFDVDLATVGQYTGLHDKNGKEIYEGDIVGFEDGMSTESGYAASGCTGCVSWDKETASFQVDNRLSAESYEVLEECAIIGNIYDNPELLEEKK